MNTMDTLVALLCGLAAFLLVLALYLRRNHGVLESLGIPVASPFLCFGSGPFLWNKVVVHEHYLQQAKKYGYTWGR